MMLRLRFGLVLRWFVRSGLFDLVVEMKVLSITEPKAKWSSVSTAIHGDAVDMNAIITGSSGAFFLLNWYRCFSNSLKCIIWATKRRF